ncbi:exopolysaccharide production protein ExoZ [Pseudomonas sp. PvR086]
MLIGIHYMRGIAALMVVIFHAISFMAIYKNYDSPIPHHVLATGVDIFFVISGYLMVKTTQKFKDSRLEWKLFLYKRLTRIAPMYWLITIAISIAILYKPSLSEKQVDIELIVKSLLFIPTHIPGSDVQSTILPVGWTLVYEMFFYIIFAALTSINYRAGLVALISFFAFLSAFHGMTDNYYYSLYSNPIILEFIFGAIIAKLPTPPHRKGLAIAFVGFVALFVGSYIDGPDLGMRVISAGLGAALIIYGASGLTIGRPLKIPSALGDASYSIYLTHMYIIKAGAKALPPSLLSCTVLSLLSVLIGYAIYRAVELPIQNLLTNRKKPIHSVVQRANS